MAYCMYNIYYSAIRWVYYNTLHLDIQILFSPDEGLKERFNQTISWCLANMINNKQQNWDKKVDTF